MNFFISCLIFLSCFIFITPLFAGTVTLSTYYPSPQGNYLNMVVNGQLTMSPGASPCAASGASIGLADVNVSGVGELEVCDSNGNDYFLTSSTLWKSGGAFIYPWSTSEYVSIGTNTNNRPLFVKGDATNASTHTAVFENAAGYGIAIGGTTVSGEPGNSVESIQAAYFLGGVENTVENLSLQTEGGNVGIGVGDINPQATLDVNGTANISGNTTVGSGSGSTVTLGSSTSGPITVCVGGSCGTLGMSCTGGTCYAIYGP